MQQSLGNTGLNLFPVAFGAGPVSGLMTAPETPENRRRQIDTVSRALECGIDWFDTAAGYGDGRSESALGRVLAELNAAHRVQVATKVRLSEPELDDIPAAIERSVRASLDRLGLPGVSLLQLHNSITTVRGTLPTSLGVDDVIGPGGVLEALEMLRQQGLTQAIGMTGLGQFPAVQAVLSTGRFQTIQLPVNALLLTDSQAIASSVGELPPAPIIRQCRELGMGVFAIRVLAGGALALAPPSPYTHVTKFFTLDVYQRDLARAREIAARLPAGQSLPEFALQQVLQSPGVQGAILGFSSPEEVESAVAAARKILPRDLAGSDPCCSRFSV